MPPRAASGGTGVPAPFRLTDEGRVEWREGGGCLSLFGVPFLLGGFVLAAGALGLIPIEGGGQWWSRPVLALMSLPFLGAGGGLAGGRRWTVLDRDARLVVRRWGLLTPLRSEERSLAEFDAVVIGFEPGDSETADGFPVRLRARTGADWKAVAPTGYGEARGQAEYLAAYLRLPLADATTAHQTTETPGHGAVPKRERDAAPQPARMRSEVQHTAGQATVILRDGRPLALATFLAAVAALAAGVVFALPPLREFFRQTGTPPGIGNIITGVVVSIFCVLPVLAVATHTAAAIRGRTVLTASRAGLQIERRGAWRTRYTAIEPGDLLDVDVSRSAGHLVVKTRSEWITLGPGVPADELHYLRQVLRGALWGQ